MSLTIVLRSISSVGLVTGTGAIAMGLGVIDVDPGMWAVATQVIGPNLIPAKPFLLFLGTSKVFGALGLWGYGLFPKALAYAACAIPPICAIYGHAKLGETDKATGAGIYLVILSALYYMESNGKKTVKKS